LHYQFAVLRIPVIKGNLGDTAELFLSGEDKPQAIEPHHPNGIVEKLKHLPDITEHAISDGRMNSMAAQVSKLSCLQRQQAAVLQASGHANIVVAIVIAVFEPAVAYLPEMSKFIGIDVFLEGNSDSISTDEVFVSVTDAAKMCKKDGGFTADMRYMQLLQSMSRGTTNKNARNLGPSAKEGVAAIIRAVSKMTFQCEANRQASAHNEVSALHFHYRTDASQNLTAFTSSSLLLGASNCIAVQTQLTREARLAIVVTRWKNQKIQRAFAMWRMLMALGMEEKLTAELEIYKAECAQLKERNEELQQRTRFLASAGLGAQIKHDSHAVSACALNCIAANAICRNCDNCRQWKSLGRSSISKYEVSGRYKKRKGQSRNHAG
jgi:hypothetical protein